MLSARAIAQWLVAGMRKKAQMLVCTYSVLSHMRSLSSSSSSWGRDATDCGEKGFSKFLPAASSNGRRSGVIDATPSLPRGDAEGGKTRITRTAHVQLIPVRSE